MSNIKVLQNAVAYLASVCDGAREQDGQGFNGVDSEFGKSLAKQNHWTDKQALSAQNMLRKYKKQLECAGFDAQELFSEIKREHPLPQPMQSTSNKTKSTKTAKVINGVIEIRFPFDQGVVDLVKTIPGRRFRNDTYPKYWTAPVSIEAAELLVKAGFEGCAELQKLSTSKEAVHEVPPTTPIPGLKRELFAFQKQGVAFIEQKGGRALIADEMGLGKSIQALAWLALHAEKRPAIILCPAHLKLNWAQEIKMTLPKEQQSVQILRGQAPYKITEDIIIINYDILTKWQDTLVGIAPQVLIFDEAHYIKSNSAARTKATKKLAKKIPHVIALTGTPIINRPIEGFNIAQVINKAVFPDFWQYANRYCGAHHNGFGWDFSGASNKEELHKKLTETIMIRRKKVDVLTDLPDKVYSYVPIELSNDKEYQKASASFLSYIKETKGKDAARKAQQAEHLVRIEGLKQLAVKGKMESAIQWIENFIESSNGDGKLVVFTTHKQTVEDLMVRFANIAVKVDGSVSTENRHQAVQAFQNNPAVKLFIGNIQAAGTGLTLTAASSVAFLELPWTPGDLVQAEDRCHRIGQKNTVNVYYLLAVKTIEMEIAHLLDEKRKVLAAVLDGKEAKEINLLTELVDRYEEAQKK